MPRKKKVFYEKTIHLFVPKDKKLSTPSKHALIDTFNHLFQARADNTANQLTESFAKAGIDTSFPKRSAHSSYKANNKLNAITKLKNQGKVTLTVCANNITECDSSDDDNFIEIRIPVLVDTLVISPWHKRNQSFIKSLGRFISTDRRFENESYGLLMAAIQQATPQSEKILIEPTVEFFKKQFGKPELEKTKKGNPLRAKLIIIENDDIDQNKNSVLSSVYLLIQPSQCISYIPFKLDTPARSENIHDYLYEDLKNQNNKEYKPNTYSVYATKQDNQMLIELVISGEHSITYQAIIEEAKGTINPFTGERTFNHSVLWESYRPNGKYTIVSSGKLMDCIIPFSAPSGGRDKASIEKALTKIYSTLSLCDFEPKMFIQRQGARKLKPLVLS